MLFFSWPQENFLYPWLQFLSLFAGFSSPQFPKVGTSQGLDLRLLFSIYIHSFRDSNKSHGWWLQNFYLQALTPPPPTPKKPRFVYSATYSILFRYLSSISNTARPKLSFWSSPLNLPPVSVNGRTICQLLQPKPFASSSTPPFHSHPTADELANPAGSTFKICLKFNYIASFPLLLPKPKPGLM